MADQISHGRTANIQRPMLDNKDILNQIPGVNITDVGGRHGPVDDHMGPKTATALESILIAAGFPKGAALDGDDQNKLAVFLAERGMDAKDAIQFAKDAAEIVKDPELGAVFRECSKADEATIDKAIEAEQKTDPTPNIEQEKTVVPTSPAMLADAGDEKYTLIPDGHKVLQSPLPQPKNTANHGVAISTMALKPNTPVNEKGQIIESKPVISQEEYASIVKEYDVDKEHVVLAPMHKSTIAPTEPKVEQPALKGDDMLMASHKTTVPMPAETVDKIATVENANQTPAVNVHDLITKAAAKTTNTDQAPAVNVHDLITKAAAKTIRDGEIKDKDPLTGQGPLYASIGKVGPVFTDSADKNSDVPKDVSKEEDYKLTMREAEKLAEKSPTTENIKLAALVKVKHEQFLKENPDLKENSQKIADLKAQNAIDRPAMNKCLEDQHRSAEFLDFKVNDMSAQPFKFEALGRTFELSLEQFRNGDYSGLDKNPSFVSVFGFGADKKLVTDAYEKTYKEGGSTDLDKPLRVEVVMNTEEKTFKPTREQIETGYKGDKPLSFAQKAIVDAAAKEALREYDAKHPDGKRDPDEEIEFTVVLDETRIFHQSLNEIRNGEFGGLHFYQLDDKKAVIAAGLEKFHEKMMTNTEYANNFAEYNKTSERIVGEDHTRGIAKIDFMKHRALMNPYHNMRYGEFGESVMNYNHNMSELALNEMILQNTIDKEIHVVKQSELDAFDPNAPDKIMVAQNDPADPTVTAPSNI